jgi:antitoxin component of RelBE/YafQ-DinJ toxin-antitoxin module
MSKLPMVHLRMDATSQAELEAIAAKLRMTRSAVVREAVRRMARQERVRVEVEDADRGSLLESGGSPG